MLDTPFLFQNKSYVVIYSQNKFKLLFHQHHKFLWCWWNSNLNLFCEYDHIWFILKQKWSVHHYFYITFYEILMGRYVQTENQDHGHNKKKRGTGIILENKFHISKMQDSVNIKAHHQWVFTYINMEILTFENLNSQKKHANLSVRNA